MTLRSWLSGIQSLVIGKARANRRKQQARYAASTAEILEIRQVPTTAVLQAGILTITGSDQGDEIAVTKSGKNWQVSGVNTTFAVSKVKSVVVNAGDGDDVVDLTALTVKAQVSGGAGNDSLIGGSKNDTLLGEAGNDVLTGNAGNDVLDGGADVDQLRESANVKFVLTNSRLTGRGTDTLIGVETASLQGGNSNNRLDASKFSGSVSLLGGAGKDTLIGGTGDDQLYGELGSDSIDGGAGFDTVDGVGDFGSWNTEQILGQSVTPVVPIPITVTIGGVVVQPPGTGSLVPPTGTNSGQGGGTGGGNAISSAKYELHHGGPQLNQYIDKADSYEYFKELVNSFIRFSPGEVYLIYVNGIRVNLTFTLPETEEAFNYLVQQQAGGGLPQVNPIGNPTPSPTTPVTSSTTFDAFVVSAWDKKLNKPVYAWFNSSARAIDTTESWKQQVYLPGGALRRAEPRYIVNPTSVMEADSRVVGVDPWGVLVRRDTGERMMQIYP